METDIENLKKRILYRSQYRGTREMDKLLHSFVLKYINKIDESRLLNLEKFLDIDDEEILKLFKNFKFNQ